MNKLMKKLYFAVLFVMTFSTVVMAQGIGVSINGVVQDYKTPPVSVEGRVLVPVRAIFEELGATIRWDGNTKTVFAYKENTAITIPIDSKTVTIQDENSKKEIQLDVPAQIINSSTYVPVRFVSEALGAEVAWDGKANSVLITYNNTNSEISEAKAESYIAVMNQILGQLTENQIVIPYNSEVSIKKYADNFFGSDRGVLEQVAIDAPRSQLEKNINAYTGTIINEKIQITADEVSEYTLDGGETITTAIVHSGGYEDKAMEVVTGEYTYVERFNYFLIYLGRNDVAAGDNLTFTGVPIAVSTIEVDYQTQPVYIVIAGDFHKRNYLEDILNTDTNKKGLSEETMNLLNKENGNTSEASLIEACMTGNLEAVKSIIDSGTDVNTSYKGMTPLGRAVLSQKVEVVKYLVDKGADLNKENPDSGYTGSTPVCLSIYQSNQEILKYLIEKGANLDTTFDEITPVELALVKENNEILKLLLDGGANPNTTYDKEYFSLSYAIKNNDLEAVKLLVEAKADLNYQGRNGVDTPLGVAIKEDKTEAVKVLVEAGADVNKTTGYGSTLLWTAKRYRNDNIIKILEDNGAKE